MPLLFLGEGPAVILRTVDCGSLFPFPHQGEGAGGGKTPGFLCSCPPPNPPPQGGREKENPNPPPQGGREKENPNPHPQGGREKENPNPHPQGGREKENPNPHPQGGREKRTEQFNRSQYTSRRLGFSIQGPAKP